MKVKYAYGKKMDRNGRKTATYYSASFPPRYCTVLLLPLRQYLLSALIATRLIELTLFQPRPPSRIFRPPYGPENTPYGSFELPDDKSTIHFFWFDT